MSCINQRLLAALPNEHKNVLVYYPDMLFFQHDAVQFRAQWDRLASSKRIYTDGTNLRPAGFWRSIYESFKGWLGFTNHCQKEKVQLTLRKFAYYGYLKGYTQSVNNFTHHPIPPTFFGYIQNLRSNPISASIQRELTSYFVENCTRIVPDNTYMHISNSNAFGRTFASLEWWREIPGLDPQNDRLISEVYEKLEKSDRKVRYTFLPNSRYALFAAAEYLQEAQSEKSSLFYSINIVSNAMYNAQACLEKAYYFDPTVVNSNKILYIEYFLEKSMFKEAYALIQQLDDLQVAGNYLTKRFTKEQHCQLVVQDSPLGNFLAEHYLKHYKDVESIRLASRFHSNLQEDAPIHWFKFLVAEKHYDEAYQLFQAKKDSVTFILNDLRLLAKYFDKCSLEKQQESLAKSKSQEWTSAKTNCFKALEAKNKSYELAPNANSKEQCHVLKRLYAEMLIDADIDLNGPTVEIDNIMIAINSLNEFKPEKEDEKKLHKKALAIGLMRQVDYLTDLFSVPLLYDRDVQTRMEHKKEHEQNFDKAILALKKVIYLLRGTKDKCEKQILGKAYYLLADIIHFFDLPQDNCNQYYEMAMKTVPNNPFYILRCSEIFETQRTNLQDRGTPLLKDLGFSVYDYADWSPARWNKEYKISNIKNIHSVEPPESSFFSFRM